MRLKMLVITLLTILAIILAACTAANPSATAESMETVPATERSTEQGGEAEVMSPTKEGEAIEDAPMEQATDEPVQDQMVDNQAAEDAMGDEGESMGSGEMAAPDWFGRELVNVRSGESFTLTDYQGKVVLVETMAIWCTNCLQQQKQVLELHEMLGERDDFISLGLDIDPFEQAPDLKTYVENNGFHWVYAVSPKETSQELSQLYGQQFLNPPSTPMLIVDRHGEAHPLPFGIKSAADLQQALEPFLSEGS